MNSLEGTLFSGGRVEVEYAFISSKGNPNILKMGYRAVLHFVQHKVEENNRFHCIGEGNTLIGALENLNQNEKVKYNPVNPQKDVEPFFNRPEHKSKTVYRKPSSWNLHVSDPANIDIKDLLDNESKGIKSEFWVETFESGDCASLQFSGQSNNLGIKPFDIIALTIDGEPTFYGQITRIPGRRDSSPKNFTVKGAKECLNRTLLGSDLEIIEQQEVSELVRHIAKTTFPSLIIVNDEKIEGEGIIVEQFNMPNRPVAQIFDDLAFKLPNSVWGVDASGEFFFYYHL